MDHVNYDFHPDHYEALSAYEWISDYLKCLEIQDEIKFLRSASAEVRKTQAAKQDMIDRYRKSWQAYESKRINYLVKYLDRGNGTTIDPFARLLDATSHNQRLKRVCIKLQWVDVKRAIDLLFKNETGDTLSDIEREKRLADLGKSISELEAQLKEHSPAGYFRVRHGDVIMDFREQFVSNWRNLQGRCNAPVCPHGGPLSSAPDVEQQAYQQLEISTAINPKGLDPNPNY